MKNTYKIKPQRHVMLITLIICSSFFNRYSYSQNSGEKIYLINIKGGGGYNTETHIKFTFTMPPSMIKGKGTSDANDGTPRVAISNHDRDFYDFQGSSWVNLSRFCSQSFYVMLNSKWGTDNDTYMELAVTVPENCRVNYEKVDHFTENLDYVNIEEKSTGKKYKIEIKGGGGYNTETHIRFTCTMTPSMIKGRGTSDANDGTPRVAISNQDGNFFDFQSSSWVDLSRFCSQSFYVMLNSKWGTDNDTYMELEVTVPENCQVNYEKIDHFTENLDYVRIHEK